MAATRTRGLFLDVATGACVVLWEDGGRRMVGQSGPSPAWDAIEEHISRWCADGGPPLERFEITVASDPAVDHLARPLSRPRTTG